ncbi:hypothetical protein HDU98_001536 [Podochytrium sp. JEL0797]|nr:hypothetical protein HDU98_001536 [Podochytrium sp. JEL0797]
MENHQPATPARLRIRHPQPTLTTAPRTPLASTAARRSMQPSSNSNVSLPHSTKPLAPAAASTNPFLLDLNDPVDLFPSFAPPLASMSSARTSLFSKPVSTTARPATANPSSSLFMKPSSLFDAPNNPRPSNPLMNPASSLLPSHTGTAAVTPPPPAEASVDVFGFGSFSDVFITEEDLKAARDKLPETEVKTNQEMLSDTLTRLNRWKLRVEPGLGGRELESSSREFMNEPNVSICCDFIILGTGSLSATPTRLEWSGILPPPETLCPGFTTTVATTITTLEWPLTILSDVRTKHAPKSDDNNIAESGVDNDLTVLMLKVEEENCGLFVQFRFNSQNSGLEFAEWIKMNGKKEQQQQHQRESMSVSDCEDSVMVDTTQQHDADDSMEDLSKLLARKRMQEMEAEKLALEEEFL